MMSGKEKLNFFRPDEPEWGQYLDRAGHDLFQTAPYHKVAESNGEGRPWLAVFGDPDKFIAWPYLLNDILDSRGHTTGLRDVTSAYGPGGPVLHDALHDPEFISRAWESLLAEWRAQGVVSAFTRFHPLLRNYELLWAAAAGRHGSERSRAGRPTVAVDSTQPEEVAWNSYRSQLRRSIRKLLDLGITVDMEAEWNRLPEFVRAYHETMRRNQAAHYYFFSEDYFRALRSALGPSVSLALTRCKNAVIGGAFVTECRGIVNVHLLACVDAFLPLAPNKLVIHECVRWARRRGNRFVYLGGGRSGGPDDQLLRFKKLFSPDVYPFYTGQWILDGNAYHLLVCDAAKRADVSPEVLASGDYFPAYRAHLPAISGADGRAKALVMTTRHS